MSDLDLDLLLPTSQTPRLARIAALRAHRDGRARSVAAEWVWHDSPDGALAQAGLALAAEHIGRTRLWRLTALHAPSLGVPPPVLAEGATPDALGRLLPPDLQPVAACTGRLRTLPLAGIGTTALSVLEGRLRTVTQEQPICRVRLHGVAAPDLAAALAGALELTVAPETLAEAALRVAGRMLPEPAPPPLGPQDGVSDAFAALLARQALVLLRLAPRAAAGDGTEPVHQMRVALRRLRSAEKLFRRAVACPQVQALGAELKELGRQLGPARDWDVFTAQTGHAIGAAFPQDRQVARLLDAAARKRAESYASLSAYLGGPAFRVLGLRFAWLAARRPWQEAAADEAQAAALARPLGEFAARALSRRLEHVLAPAEDVAGLSAEALHSLRIEAKRLRYAAEFFAPLYPARPVRRFVRRVSALQERLGQLNDGTVAAGLMGALRGADRSYAAGVVRGFVAAAHPRAREKALRTFKRMQRLEPFWE